MSLWILQHNSSPPALISSAALPGDLYLFNFAIAISTSKGLGSGTNGSAVCIRLDTEKQKRRIEIIWKLFQYVQIFIDLLI
jgi:hypothetical protein